jgi:5'(3')-deoxyribonucleotidase
MVIEIDKVVGSLCDTIVRCYNTSKSGLMPNIEGVDISKRTNQEALGALIIDKSMHGAQNETIKWMG